MIAVHGTRSRPLIIVPRREVELCSQGAARSSREVNDRHLAFRQLLQRRCAGIGDARPASCRHLVPPRIDATRMIEPFRTACRWEERQRAGARAAATLASTSGRDECALVRTSKNLTGRGDHREPGLPSRQIMLERHPDVRVVLQRVSGSRSRQRVTGASTRGSRRFSRRSRC